MDNKKQKKTKPQRAAKPKQEKKKSSKSSKTTKTLGNKKTLKKNKNLFKFEHGELELDEESYSKKVNILISKIKNKYLFDSDDSENKIRLGWK